MASRLIPLFPLHVVVFPRTKLPLHIFEERYKEMVGDAIRDESEFGIVLAKEEGIVNTGCTVGVDQVLEMYPDGRMDIMTSGRRRFEITGLNEDKSYLQGEVTFFDDEDFAPPPEELRQQAVEQYRELNALPASREHLAPDLADRQLSFQLAQAVPDVDFLSGLLRQRSETGRLKALSTFLADYIPRQRTIERMKVLAPTNGFGGKPAGM
jgi:ATP-dependent Lon protease